MNSFRNAVRTCTKIGFVFIFVDVPVNKNLLLYCLSEANKHLVTK
jgi:hypothetical protein